MSRSLESWESVADTVGRYYGKSMPPYFNARHIGTAVEIVGELLGKTSYVYVESYVSLPEPIWHDRNVVYFSVPMIAHYVNQPVYLPRDKVKYVSRFDIFDGIKVVHGEEARRQRSKVSTAPYVVNWTTMDSDEFGLDESDATVLVQTFRVVMLASHWFQHYTRKTTYRNHHRFHEIEMADIALYRKLTCPAATADATNSNSSKKIKTDDDGDKIGYVYSSSSSSSSDINDDDIGDVD